MHRLLALLLTAWLLAVAPARAQTLVVQDDSGHSHTFAAVPLRIVSLLPSLTESVCALGACHLLVGVDRWSNWPAQVTQLPRLGGLDDALIEAVVRLQPDLVLASTASRALDRLDVLGLRVLRLRSDTHDDVRRSLQLLATVLGVPAQGPQAWARIDAELVAAAARVPPALRGRRVYFEVGGGPYAAGTTSFIGQTLQRLGLANIVPASLGPFPKLNPEFVLRAQPDILMGAAQEVQAMADRAGWSALKALQRDRRCAFDADSYETMIRPGPRLGLAAGQIADCLQRLGALQ